MSVVGFATRSEPCGARVELNIAKSVAATRMTSPTTTSAMSSTLAAMPVM